MKDQGRAYADEKDEMEFKIQARRKIYEDVRDFMVGEIIAGRLSVGEALPSERDLMEWFGTGRPAIREALLSLQQMGFIEISNGERARVTEPNAHKLTSALSGAALYYLSNDEGIRQFQGARLYFEVGMARSAAQRATDEQIGLLERALTKNKRAVGDQRMFEKTDIDFHTEIVRISENRLLVGVYEALRSWLTEQVAVVSSIRGTVEKAVEHHTEIYNAISERDEDAAEQAVRKHLSHVSQRYWQSIRRKRAMKLSQ